jgi:hypothetical protein
MIRYHLLLLWSALTLLLGLSRPASAGPKAQDGSGAPRQEPGVATQPDLRIDEAGITAGEPIHTGFVFVDGRYLEAPYVISRRGIALFANDTMIRPPLPWPSHTRPAGDVDPPLPLTIDRKTSFYDPIVRAYLDQKTAYIEGQTGAGDERQAMESMYRSLPFVKEAAILPGSSNTLQIVTYSGEMYNLGLMILRRRGLDSKEGVLRELEMLRQHYERLLSRGAAFYFFSSGSEITVSHLDAPQQLARLVPILRSNMSAEQKFEQIKKARVSFVDRKNFPAIVTKFSASPQLEARLRELENQALSTAPAPAD